MPRSVLELAPNAEHFTTRPLMTVDTYLASRPGFKTPAFAAFRDILSEFSDIQDSLRLNSGGSE